LIASIFTVALLSLAGIPATMGFLGKFYVLTAGTAAAAWPLIIILVVTSVAGLYYYLRIVVTLYSATPEYPAPIPIVSGGETFGPSRIHNSPDLAWSLSGALAQPDPNNHARAQLSREPRSRTRFQLLVKFGKCGDCK
jgi:NADH:ubiquinone oxidoreductase subunit 5 (subunit L)/multisubunit Na+/H+ antiporter MnhA subunit